MHSSIITIIILLCLPRIFQKALRMEAGQGSGFSRLVTSPVSSQGEWKGLYSSSKAFSSIPSTWPYRRNTFRPRVRWGQGRKRPLCRAVSRTDRWEKDGRRQGSEAVGNFYPWHHRKHSHQAQIASYSPAIVLKCCLIQQQSKNKPLSGSFSWAYPATSPHLLCTVKT